MLVIFTTEYSIGSQLVRPIAIEEIAQKSELVIFGKVKKVKSYRGKTGKGIYSIADVKVKEVMKGVDTRKIIQVEFEGGMIGWKALSVSVVEPLDSGDNVVLFLRKFESRVLDKDIYMMGGWVGTIKLDFAGMTEKDMYMYTFKGIQGKRFEHLHLNELREIIRSVE